MAELRIISHMNKDHKLSIEDYLVVYGKVVVDDKISNIKLTQIDLNHLTISFKHEDIEFEIEKSINFDPPLKSLNQAREKLVEMAKYSANQRNLSHIQIIDYIYPKIFGWLLILIIYLPLLSWIFPSIIKNDISINILGPWFVQFITKHGLNVFFLTIGIHYIEAEFILKPLLKKYRIPTDVALEWFIATIIEGYPAISRLHTLIKDKEH